MGTRRPEGFFPTLNSEPETGREETARQRQDGENETGRETSESPRDKKVGTETGRERQRGTGHDRQ